MTQTTPIEGQMSMSGYCWFNGRWCHPFSLEPLSDKQFQEEENKMKPDPQTTEAMP